MRPRVFPAEDVRRVASREGRRPASMRPRVFPAEDRPSRESPCCSRVCFNEAAGIPRGRPRRGGERLVIITASMRRAYSPRKTASVGAQDSGARRASMRPRVFPAEDLIGVALRLRRHVASMRPRVFPADVTSRPGQQRQGSSGFNEAAGIPRGRPSCPRPPWPTGRCFNEAAGIPRGRRASLR